MGQIVDFQKYIDHRKSGNDEISLASWLGSFRSDEELREVFLNMDRAMRYVHSKGFCVDSFDPNRIQILNHSINQIKFEDVSKMNGDPFYQEEIKKEDVYRSSFLQIGIYSKCLPYLKPDFLKENFKSFENFLPERDIPYYKGIVQSRPLVYFCEYDLEKRKRDLATLEKEVEGTSMGAGKSLVKSNGQSILNDADPNNQINENIYKQLNSMSDAAFISFLIYPTIVCILVFVLALLGFILVFS